MKKIKKGDIVARKSHGKDILFNEALFVSLLKPCNRLKISGIKILIKNLGKEVNINKYNLHGI